jgi:hypothetical protein
MGMQTVKEKFALDRNVEQLLAEFIASASSVPAAGTVILSPTGAKNLNSPRS